MILGLAARLSGIGTQGRRSDAAERQQEMGQIKVTVQTEERMAAIGAIARACESLADALNRGVNVTIRDCSFVGGEPAISVDTMPEVTHTEIVEVDDD